jgi:hypothetical protein
LKNIKVSPVFTILVIIIVASVFLFPNILSTIKLRQFDDQIEADFKKHSNNIYLKDKQILESLNSLNIQDVNLTACMKNEIQKFIGRYTGNRVSNDVVDLIKTLNCQRKGIVTINGIENLKYLSHLDLSGNPLSNIRPLVHLTELKSLHLSKVHLKDINELFSLRYLNRFSPPILTEAYCEDIEKWSKELSIKSAAHIDSTYECKGGSSDVLKVSQLQAKQALGAELTTDEEILVLEYRLNQQKKSYREGRFKGSAGPIELADKNNMNDEIVVANSITTQVCEADSCNSIKDDTKISFVPNDILKACFTRSSGGDGSEMFIKKGRISSGKLSYSCYIPVSSADSRSKKVNFKRSCKQFVKSFLDCSDEVYNEGAMDSLRKQFRAAPKVLTVKFDGVENIAIELNH